jgi:hypothetical protein
VVLAGAAAAAEEQVLTLAQGAAAAIPAVPERIVLVAQVVLAMVALHPVEMVVVAALMVQMAETLEALTLDRAAQAAQQVITLSEMVLLRGPPQVRVKVQQLNWSKNEQHQIQNQKLRRGQQLPADFVCFRCHGQHRSGAVPCIRIPARNHVAGCRRY